MLPNSTENILQDTKSVPDAPVSRKNNVFVLIAILFLFVAIGLYVRKMSVHSASSLLPSQIGQAAEETPVPPTNTFVDRLYGTVAFYQGSILETVSFPDRSEHVIVGIDQKSEVALSAYYPPVWSPDGKLLAVVTPENKIVISEFDTGAYKGTFPLPVKSTPQSINYSIDPASEILSISQVGTVTSDPSVRFFSLATQKEIGIYPRCISTGVWMTGVGFAMSCKVGDTQSVVVIRFEPNSSVMTPLARETSGTRYTVIDEYKPGVLFLKRSRGSTSDLITLDANGKIGVIPPGEYKSITNLDQIVNATDVLKARIENEAHTKPVRYVTVASNNSFLVFETEDGLYVAKLDLKEAPFFLGKGTLPRIRPY